MSMIVWNFSTSGVESSMLDPSVTRAVLAAEAPALQALARRAGWTLMLDVDALILRLDIVQQRTGELFVLRGELDGYKEIPPAWDFVDPDTDETGTAVAYPLPPNPTPGGGPTLFINSNPRARVICMPCNRLAFQVHGGPHSDWSLTGWMRAHPGGTTPYITLSDMVSRINTELQASTGRWASRPRSQS